MKKLFYTAVFFILTLFGFLFTMMGSLLLYRSHLAKMYTVAQNKTIYAALPTIQDSFSTEIIAIDGRTEAVRQFFARFDSPLEPYASDIVKAADEYGIDFRLLPAIAMQESNLCKKMPDDSNNCWGFGIYGGKITRFNNFSDAIYTISKTLATNYKDHGLVTPEEIVTRYTPSNDGSWAFSVNHFMDELQ